MPSLSSRTLSGLTLPSLTPSGLTLPGPVRALLVAPSLAVGALVSMCTVLLHDYWWGLVLGLVTSAALLVALPGGWWSRFPAALGWVAVLVVLGQERSEGDLLVTADLSGYLLLAAGLIIFVGGFVGLVGRPSRHPSPRRRVGGDAGSSGIPT